MNTFPNLCQKMHEVLKKVEPNLAAWRQMEAEALAMIDELDQITARDINVAIFHSGSGRLCRSTWDKAHTLQRDSFVSNHGVQISSAVIRNLSVQDIRWLDAINCTNEMRRSCLQVLLNRHEEDYLTLLSHILSDTPENLLVRALSALPGNLPRQSVFAPQLQRGLWSLRRSDEGKELLRKMLNTALEKKDTRYIAAILSLGVALPLDAVCIPQDTPQPTTDLIAKLGSYHGRLALVASEPRTRSILERSASLGFYGLKEDGRTPLGYTHEKEDARYTSQSS